MPSGVVRLAPGNIVVTATAASAEVRWSSALPAAGAVEIGLGGTYALRVMAAPRLAKTHDVIIKGLRPGAEYQLRVTDVVDGVPSAVESRFQTLPIGSSVLGSKGITLTLDGDPFFPIIDLSGVCPETVQKAVAAHMNVLARFDFGDTTMGYSFQHDCGGEARAYTDIESTALAPFLDAVKGNAFVLAHSPARRRVAGPDTYSAETMSTLSQSTTFAGWVGLRSANTQYDAIETAIDTNKFAVISTFGWLADSGWQGWLNFGGWVNQPGWPYKVSGGSARAPLLPRIFSRAGMILAKTRLQLASAGLDPECVAGPKGSGLALAAAYEIARALSAAGKPFSDTVNLTIAWTRCRNSLVTPDRVRAQVWLSLAGGATGIAYDTSLMKPWEAPTGSSPSTSRSGKDWALDPAMEAAITDVHDRIASIEPALLSPPAFARTLKGTAVHAGARTYGGSVYVIAVNASRSAVQATINVHGTAGTSADVLWEGPRTVPVSDGTISDAFGPLAVHVYRLVAGAAE